MTYPNLHISCKKYLAPLLFIPCFVGNVAGQTMEDTAHWIIAQTEVNPVELRHSIEGGLLVSHVSIARNIGGLSGGVIEKGVPIGKIARIEYTHTSEYLSYAMSCNSPCAFSLEEPETMRPKFLFEIYKKLDAGYVGRMNKALAHLVKLHGGHAIPVRAAIPKEVF